MGIFAGVQCAFDRSAARCLIVVAALFLSAPAAHAEEIAQLNTNAIGCTARETAESLARAVWSGDRKQIIAAMKAARSAGGCKQIAKETLVEILASHQIDVARKGRKSRAVSLAQIRELGRAERYWIMSGQLQPK